MVARLGREAEVFYENGRDLVPAETVCRRHALTLDWRFGSRIEVPFSVIDIVRRTADGLR